MKKLNDLLSFFSNKVVGGILSSVTIFLAFTALGNKIKYYCKLKYGLQGNHRNEM